MKTITEFSGFTLNDAIKKMHEVMPKPEKPKFAKKELPIQEQTRKNFFKGGKPRKHEVAEKHADAGSVENAKSDVAAPIANETTSAPKEAESQAPVVVEPQAVTAEVTVPAGTEQTAPAGAEQIVTEQTQTVPAAPQIDLKAIMAETFKLEGEKLDMFMIALDVAAKRPNHIKRVVVLTLGEGEKSPQNALEKDGKIYMLEHFFIPKPKGEFRGKGGGKFGKGKFGGKGRRGGKGRGDNRGDGRDNRGEGGGGGRFSRNKDGFKKEGRPAGSGDGAAK